MKAIYTDAAKREFEAFQARQQEMLESIVAERKLVLGDDILEITASDIKAASKKIQIYRPTLLRIKSTELVMLAYIIIGLAMMAGSILYPQLMDLYASNRTQAVIFLTGAIMTLAGCFFRYWIRERRIPALELDDIAADLASKHHPNLRTPRSPNENRHEA